MADTLTDDDRHRSGTDPADRARIPLLTLITAEALEQDYQEAADRHAAGAPRERGSRAAVLVVVVAFGLLVAVAAAQTSRNADIRDASRSQIIDRIETNRERQRDEQARLAELRESNASAESGLLDLGGALGELQSEVTELETVTGFGAVRGEGIQIRFDNLTGSDPRTEWVRDSDLAALANGLWVAGAEAISINGQRLTAAGGIRNVGTVVEVNSRAVAPPYTVLAIGDTDTLPGGLLDSTSGASFYSLAQQYGWEPTTRAASEVEIPAAPADLRPLRSAQQLEPDATGGAQ
jgi:uncharacterized protein YlxW (UPF0749 family)